MGNPNRAALLRKAGANPATKDLPALKEERFLNLPYAMRTSAPLNIDAPEAVRTTLEEWELAPTEATLRSPPRARVRSPVQRPRIRRPQPAHAHW